MGRHLQSFVDLDDTHHTTVSMKQNMTMVYEFPHEILKRMRITTSLHHVRERLLYLVKLEQLARDHMIC
jgi:hypothetical protein